MQTPDDSSFALPALRYLLTPPGQDLLAQSRSLRDTPSTITRLRKSHPQDAVHIAFTLARLRPKAAKKFPPIPALFTPQEALEQATSLAVALHKTKRFAAYFSASNITHPILLDACSGIGGDSLALASVAHVLALDLSSIRQFCLAQNAAQFRPSHPITPIVGDITSPPLNLARFAAFHIDPARRSAGQRHHAYADMLPGPETIARLLTHIPAGAIKLSPAVDFDSLPPGHLELIAEDSTVVQAVLYTGPLAAILENGHRGPDQFADPRDAEFRPLLRTATSLKHGQTLYSYTAPVIPLALLVSPMDFLAEVDPAVHRAGLAPALAQELRAHPVNSDGGAITAPIPFTSPAVTPFRHITTIPFSEKRLRALLPTLPKIHPGPVEVKSRGRLDIDTDRLQRILSAATDQCYTVLLYKAHDRIMASLATRTSEPQPSEPRQ